MNKTEKYAELILTICVKLLPGEKLFVWCPLQARGFAKTVMLSAYKKGAACAEMFCEDDKVSDISVKVRNERLAKENYKMLWLCTSDYAVLKECGIEALQTACSMPQIPFSVAYVATPQWARLLYPETDEATALKRLWEAIFTACRISGESPFANWQKHITNLHNKLSVLNSFHFKALRYTTGIGTDVTVRLHNEHKWISCTSKTAAGDFHTANLPTEEVFTAPLRTGTNGKVVVSKPFILYGKIIEGCELFFKDGELINYTAKANVDALEKLIKENENACYLGEAALVSSFTPVSSTAFFWYESTFDENTGCHLALGNAYADTLINAGNKSPSELVKIGINQSNIHEDFMIGTHDLTVTGLGENKNITIIQNGEWCI